MILHKEQNKILSFFFLVELNNLLTITVNFKTSNPNFPIIYKINKTFLYYSFFIVNMYIKNIKKRTIPLCDQTTKLFILSLKILQ